MVNISLRVLHLLRDAPAYVASAKKNSGLSTRAAIARWNRMASQMARLERTVPAADWMRIHYEDLCLNPQQTLRTITDWLGLPPHPWPVSFRDAPNHIIGNRMRLQATDEVVLDVKWTERLSAGEIDTVLRRTRTWRKRMGLPEQPIGLPSA